MGTNSLHKIPFDPLLSFFKFGAVETALLAFLLGFHRKHHSTQSLNLSLYHHSLSLTYIIFASKMNGQESIVGRTDQLDAEELDSELLEWITNEKLVEAYKLLPLDHKLHNYKQELRLLLRLVYFAHSLSRDLATFGMSSLGFKFKV